MKPIKVLIQNISTQSIHGSLDNEVHALVLDSRKVNKGDLFVAIKGGNVDGHQYITTAIAQGAVAILCEVLPDQMADGVCYIQVVDSSAALGLIASTFFDNPSKGLKVVAVTGTNGKTTTATLLFNLFSQLGFLCGLVSTVNNRIGSEIIPATHTTPDAISLNALLRSMADAGCTHVFMEASSHAIHQNRIKGLRFEGLIFTNITHDHLDYHKTFSAYISAKKKLFDEVNADAWALTNKDDKNGLVMLQNTGATRYTYALKQIADFKTRIVECDLNGLCLELDQKEAWFQLTGAFNAYNLLAVYAAALLLGEDRENVITAMSSLKSVSGRFDYIKSNQGIIGIVDYAHTPDALKNVLDTINEVRTHNETLIVVLGCGGDRDREKRPIMAEVAVTKGDKLVLTSDNPRSENPETILDEMQHGIPAEHFKKMLRITDRKEAIRAAVSMASSGDIILLAGKGHETYQDIMGTKFHFDDKEVIAEMFKTLEK